MEGKTVEHGKSKTVENRMESCSIT